jgi:hypothetical protein
LVFTFHGGTLLAKNFGENPATFNNHLPHFPHVNRIYPNITCFLVYSCVYLLQDSNKEETLPLQEVTIDEILELQRAEQLSKQLEEERIKKAMLDRGLVPHGDPIQEEFL